MFAAPNMGGAAIGAARMMQQPMQKGIGPSMRPPMMGGNPNMRPQGPMGPYMGRPPQQAPNRPPMQFPQMPPMNGPTKFPGGFQQTGMPTPFGQKGMNQSPPFMDPRKSQELFNQFRQQYGQIPQGDMQPHVLRPQVQPRTGGLGPSFGQAMF